MLIHKTQISEIKRKILHLSSAAVPITYDFLQCPIDLLFVMISCSTVMLLDFYRRTQPDLTSILNPILRSREISGPSGAFYMMLSFIITSLLFQKNITIISWWILVIADPCSCFAHKFFSKSTQHKSTLSFIGFFIPSYVIGYLNINSLAINHISLMISVLITGFFEHNNKLIGIDDNLSIPIVFCICVNAIHQIQYAFI